MSQYWSYNFTPQQTTGKGAVPAPNYMPQLMAVGALSSAFSSWMQARSQKHIARANARIGEMQARDAMKRGHEAEAATRQKSRKLIGSQRAALAAQGIRTDFGSALDVQQEAADIGELDALTLKNNALREAFGYRSEALNATMQGALASRASMNQGMETLLTGGLRYFDWRNR